MIFYDIYVTSGTTTVINAYDENTSVLYTATGYISFSGGLTWAHCTVDNTVEGEIEFVDVPLTTN